MSSTATVPMIAPDGSVGDVPRERVQQATSSGFKMATDMVAPDGTRGAIPNEKVSDAIKSGFKQFASGPSKEELQYLQQANAARPFWRRALGLSPTDERAQQIQQKLEAQAKQEIESGVRDWSQNDPVGWWSMHGPLSVGAGVADVAKGNVARGGHEIISGAGVSALPVIAPAAAAAPVATAGAIGLGTVAGAAGRESARALGASDDQADLAGDITGIAGSVAGGKGAQAITGSPLARKALGKTAEVAMDLMEPKKFIMGKLRSAVDRLNNPQMDLFKNTPKLGESEPTVSPFESASKPQIQAKAPAFNESVRPLNKTFDLLDQKLTEVHKLMDDAGIPRMEAEAPSAPAAPRKTSFGSTPSRPAIRATQPSANPSPVLSNGKPIDPNADLTDIMMRSIAAAQNKAGSTP